MFTACFVQSPILTRKSCCSSHVSPTQRVIVTSCTHFEMEEQLVLFIQCKKSGIRRGGILSPLLLNIFAEWLISALKLSDLWCHIADCYVGCIAYADDLILLSGSLTQLQSMHQLCDRHARSLDLIFNCRNLVCSKLELASMRLLVIYI